MEAQTNRLPGQRATGKRALVKEQNRRVILDAARRVFAQLGYGPTTVRDIIRATPLASGTFYNYFRSKDEVFQAMRDEAALTLRPLLREARANAETAAVFVSATFEAFFSYVVANRGNPAVARGDIHVRVDTPEILAGLTELRADLERAIARGIFPPVDPELLAASMIGTAFEIAEILQRREAAGAEEAARFATTLFLSGLSAFPKPVAG